MFWSKRTDPVDQLTKRLQMAVAAADTAATVNALINEECQLSPWAAWALIGLARHRDRQRWVTSIVRSRLSGSPEELQVAGAFAHPETIPQHGVVPGMIDWEYYFHGIGCCLTHRTTGESIDVDFHDETGDYIDDWFYVGYLRSLREPEFPEQRLIQLHPSFDPLILAFEDLKQAGALQTHPRSKVFRLTMKCEALCEVVDAFTILLGQPDKRLLVVLAAGDALAAQSLLTGESGDLKARVERQATKQRDLKIGSLLRWNTKPDWTNKAFLGLLDIQAPQIDHLIQKNLRGQPSGAMNSTLDHLLRSLDARWCDEVYRLYQRLSPERDIPEPAAWASAVEFLLRTNHRKEQVIQGLLNAKDRATADAALLALEFAPKFAPELFYRALSSTVPMERTEAAAALAVLDEPWAIKQMVTVLADSQDREFTSTLRGALVCSRDQSAHDAVLAWERQHPMKPHEGIGYTWEEVAEANRDSWVQHRMTLLHDRVLPLRGRAR